MIIEYDIEKDYLYKKGINQGRHEGRQEGRLEGILMLAKTMKENGEPIDKIIEVI